MDGGGIKGDMGSGSCCSCRSDMTFFLSGRDDLLYRLRIEWGSAFGIHDYRHRHEAR